MIRHTLNERYSKRYTGFFILALLLLLFVQRLSLSFSYYPICDDWFHYYGMNIADAQKTAPVLSIRPLAGLLDALIVPLSGHMLSVQLALTAMLATAALFLIKAFRSVEIYGGPILAVVLVLSPIAFEGLYWISASDRIIPSIFFISLSAYALSSYIETRKTSALVIYILSGIGSVGFYESFVPVYLILNAAVILCLKNRSESSLRLLIVPLFWTAAIGIYYFLNSKSELISERADTVEASGFFSHIIYAVNEYFTMLVPTHIQLIRESFADGIGAYAEHPVSAALTILLSAAVTFFARPTKGRTGLSISIGILLILGGATANSLIGYVRVPFRLSAPILIGFGIVLEALISLIPGKLSYRIAVFILASSFAICSTGELRLYKYTTDSDMQYASALAELPEVSNKMRWVFICGTDSYCYNDRIQYYEYVKSARENFSSLTENVRCILGTSDTNFIEPLPDNTVIEPKNFDSENLLMLRYDGHGSFKKCTVEKNDTGYVITAADGEYVGSLAREGDNYRYTDATHQGN